MRDLPWESVFDAAYCWGNSFGYFPHAEVPAFCRALGRALQPGARLVIDTGLAAESILPTLQPRRWYQLDDLYLLHETRYLAEESRVQSDYIFLRKGTVETRTAMYAVFTVAELRRLLLDHGGLVVEALYGSIDRQPFTMGSSRLLLVAKKEE
jgi:SAM-dependent methyltransferase